MSAASSIIGLRSAPPPNHQAAGVQNIRVFMCTAGVSGERMWATRLIPLAQKRGSSARPGISFRAVRLACARGSRRPWTVETLTPTFSNTRPRITAMTPPPPSPSAPRRVALRSKRPGGRSACGPASSLSSSASKAAQMRSRSVSNHADARAFSLSPTAITRLRRFHLRLRVHRRPAPAVPSPAAGRGQ